MGIFSKNKTIRALGKISILAFGLFMLAQPVMAAPEYRKVPDCGPNAIVDGQPTACTYSDKSTTTCIRTTTEEDGKTVRKYECTNADTSKTACTIIGSGIPECTVTELSGTTYDTNDGNVNGVKSFTDGLLGGALLGVSLFILTLASTLLGFIGSAFNWAVINTIFNFGSIFGTSESMIIAWGVLRDVGNIVLLFGFILMGVLTILNLHDYPVKKTIPGLIIFAVLLNFSLFASQVVIDVSNAFSSIFYEQASSQCENAENVRECVKNDNSGISGIIVEQAGLTSAFSIDEQNGANLTTLGRGIIYLGLALFVTVAAIVLLAATVMLVVRAVMLSFLMVVSPIGFAVWRFRPLRSSHNDGGVSYSSRHSLHQSSCFLYL
ncbi:hypothetical protein KKH15_02120 [Patescibacteria group bacterium]|nr:hypothetical protein [Patescibacteria group bacterium]MBU1755075.1 hypothetical protein [Patescibacteria group bacterium]